MKQFLLIYHYNPLLIRNRSWILTIHKARILWKKPLRKTFLAFKKWVKSIQTAGYNDGRTVNGFLNKILNSLNTVCRVDAVGSSQIFFPTQNLERAYQVDKEAVLSYFQYFVSIFKKLSFESFWGPAHLSYWKYRKTALDSLST